MKAALIIAAAFLASTAVAAPSRQELAAARFQPLPPNYVELSKSFFAASLKDPYSAVYEFQKPRRGWWKNGLLVGGGYHFAHIIPVILNAKNSFGGYTGRELHYLAYENSQIVECTSLFVYKRAGFIDAP